VEKKMTEIPEPMDKLDTQVVVSGPEDDAERWRQVDWRRAAADVRRLRQRIFTASKAGDLQRVRRLQKLMLRSRANTLVSVRRVTERNAGRLTAGVDGEVVLTPEAKMQLVDRVQQNTEPFKAMPVRRVYIPKPGGKQRPLGIPVIVDRVHQARVVNALEPEWEARFEPRSYGFRPGRGCQDATQAVHETAKGKSARRLWALDADLASAFDLIAHQHILNPTDSGDVAPSYSIAGSATGLDFPVGLDVDTNGNVYASNFFGNSITVYSPTTRGDAAPTTTLSGAATGLAAPEHLAVTPPLAILTHSCRRREPTATTAPGWSPRSASGAATGRSDPAGCPVGCG
jgi:hypothetical protein